jgi:hypothetical protein
MAISSSALVQRVRDILEDRAFQDSSTTTGTGTTITVTDTSIYSPGAIVEWQTGAVGYEQMYVRSITNATDMVVIRGYNGTTAETHTSGDAIVVNPSFTGRNIQQSITQILNESYPQAWVPGTVSLTWTGTTKWYNLNALTLGIVSVTQIKNTTVTDYGRFRDKYQGDGLSYIVQRDLPTGVVASTTGISFPLGVYDSRTSGGNAIVVRDVRAITGTSDIEDSATLPVAEAIVWGVCGRLLKAKEARRVAAGEPATVTGTVGTGVRFGLGREYEQEWRNRLERIKYALADLYDPDDIWGH